MKARAVPLALGLAVVAALLVTPAAAQPADATWYRVGFADRITAQDRSALDAIGVRDVQYVPTNSYVAFATPRQVAAVEALDGVVGVRAVAAADKISPQLAGRSGDVVLQVVAHGLPALGVEEHSRFAAASSGGLGGLVVSADAADVGRIAAHPAVLHVGVGSLHAVPEDEGTGQILTRTLTDGGTPQPGYRDFLRAAGVDGSGVTVAVTDTGIDETHPDLSTRVVAKVEYSKLPTGMPEDRSGHGTHVAGIIAGTGSPFPVWGPVQDADGLDYGLGVAPGASLVDMNFLDRDADFPAGGYPQVTRDVMAAGAVGWSASWADGTGVGEGYTAAAALMDALVRDADQQAEGNQAFWMVFSAGNSGDGGGTSRITPPKEAKNIIAVAASESHRHGVGGWEQVLDLSSRGPARDGRVVPTITAPGASVASARSRACSCVPIADSLGLHRLGTGTSMAAPHVTGAVALLTQWWRQHSGGADPSPALVKALLVNTADDMNTPDIPNRHEGWGLVNVAALFDRTAERVVVDQDIMFTDVGDSHAVAFEAVDPSRPVRATLVWTDAPGFPPAPFALVNDLDLRLTTPAGALYQGNNFVDGVSVAGGAADRINNVENVYLPAGEAGTYRLSVTAAHLPDDGVPHNPTLTDQDFALVVSNARVVN